MGWKWQEVPNHVLNMMEGRPDTKEWQTSEEATLKAAHKRELAIHRTYWNWLNLNNFEDVEYSSPKRRTRARLGRPDFLVCRDSRRLGIEFKVKPNKLSPEQLEFFKMAERQGNECVLCYDFESARAETMKFFNLQFTNDAIPPENK